MHLFLFGRLITPLGGGDALDLLPGWLAADRSGSIVAVGGGAPPGGLRGFATTDLRRFAAVPGFVDAHLHYPQVDIRGQGGGELLEWLQRQAFPAEQACADARVARRLARRTFGELAAHGVTTAAVYGSPHAPATEAAFAEAQGSGLRLFLGMVLMDRNGPEDLLQSPGEALELSRRLCRRWDGEGSGRLRYAFSPRFAPACTFGLLRDTARVAAGFGALVQTHLSESEAEVRWVRHLFPGAASATTVYRDAGLLSPRTVLGHAVHLAGAEWELLRGHGPALAHCPTSNFSLRSGTFDLTRALHEGVRFGLGSDVGAGPSFSPFDVMRHASYLAPVAPTELLHRATLGGASALGLADRVGSLEVEKDADVAVLDPARLDLRLDLPLESLLGALALRGGASPVVGTLARGEWVHTDAALEA